jgi:hypothetical protein
MKRIPCVAALSAVVLALLAPAADAHKADPNYLTQVKTIQPPTSGVSVSVINRSDQLLLHNTSGKDVVVFGYEKEPYARVLADGTVEVNTNSPAYYLNEDRYGTTKPPAGVTARSPAKWKTLDKTARFQWHDHRMHWMGKSRPPQVKDPNKRTKIYDWKVPITIGSQAGAIGGTLLWTPKPGGSAPVGAIIAGLVIVIGLALMVFIVRRRRAAEGEDAVADDKTPVATGGEAW